MWCALLAGMRGFLCIFPLVSKYLQYKNNSCNRDTQANPSKMDTNFRKRDNFLFILTKVCGPEEVFLVIFGPPVHKASDKKTTDSERKKGV